MKLWTVGSIIVKKRKHTHKKKSESTCPAIKRIQSFITGGFRLLSNRLRRVSFFFRFSSRFARRTTEKRERETACSLVFKWTKIEHSVTIYSSENVSFQWARNLLPDLLLRQISKIIWFCPSQWARRLDFNY